MVCTIIVIILLLVPATAYASGPIVCLSGAGNVSLTNFDLASCGAPTDQPIYVVMRVKSGGYSAGRGQMTEGSLSCDVYAPLGNYTECAVTVRDGAVDQITTSNTPENFQVTATWVDQVQPTGIFTAPVTSGAVLTIERSFTYGEIAIGGALFFIACVLVLALFVALIGFVRS